MPKDKVKQNEYQRAWYKRNAELRRVQIRQRKREIADWFREYCKGTCCSRCPEDHPACLDFHHLDPTTKRYTIAQIAYRGYSIETIQRELDKCVILCANCHRKAHGP